MASVFDVAQYILEKQGVTSVMKLQKLVYYCQAWSLVWKEKPLFDEKIEAWANGPVVRKLYALHKGEFQIASLPKGSSDNLTPVEIATINSVLECYGDKTAQWLSDLTHLEAPWNGARKGYAIGASCVKEITPASMHEYYSSIPPEE